MMGFSARLIPDFATTAEPLRKVDRKDSTFVQEREQQQAFEKLKKNLASASVLAYFDRQAHTRVIADASPISLGAILVQEKDGETIAVCYASRSLSSVERRYSQTQMEDECKALFRVLKPDFFPSFERSLSPTCMKV